MTGWAAGSSAGSALGHQGLHPPRVGRREGGAGAAQRLGLESSAPRRPLPRAAVGEGDSGPGERSCALASPRPRRGQALWAQRSALPMRVPRGGPPGSWLRPSPARCAARGGCRAPRGRQGHQPLRVFPEPVLGGTWTFSGSGEAGSGPKPSGVHGPQAGGLSGLGRAGTWR